MKWQLQQSWDTDTKKKTKTTTCNQRTLIWYVLRLLIAYTKQSYHLLDESEGEWLFWQTVSKRIYITFKLEWLFFDKAVLKGFTLVLQLSLCSARTAQDGLLQKRPEEDLCWIVPPDSLMTQLVKGLTGTELSKYLIKILIDVDHQHSHTHTHTQERIKTHKKAEEEFLFKGHNKAMCKCTSFQAPPTHPAQSLLHSKVSAFPFFLSSITIKFCALFGRKHQKSHSEMSN